MKALFTVDRPMFTALALSLLVIAASGRVGAQQRSEQIDIKSQIHGDSSCVISAKRWFFTWKQYNDAKDEAFDAGETIDQETMFWYADEERRTSWRILEYNPPMSLPTGRVDGEENTRFGSIPHGADIQVGYKHDWKVTGKYGWGSRRQPRVESVTEIKIDPDFEAIIEVENDIDFTAKASLSGTAGAKKPWPQIAKHDVTLIAIDINGKQHTRKGHANATVTRSHSSSSTDGSSSTTSWSINGSVGGSASGPSGSVGGSFGQSNTESHSTTSGESVPTIDGKSYGEDLQYHHTARRVFRVPCGGTAKFSRAAQVSGNFFTRSMAPHGSVSSKGNFAVSNTARITVTCIPCRGGDDEDDPVDDPTGKNPDDDPSRNPGGNNTPGGNPGGGNAPGGSLDPLEREGVTYTPTFGGRHYPGDWWDNPIIRAGGCIYIDPRSFDRFLAIPESEASQIDPWFLEQDGRIPIVVPDHNDWTHVAAANSVADVILRPFPGTPAFLLLGPNRVVFDGPFLAIDPVTGVEHPFGGGFVEFAVGGAPRLEGSFQLRTMPGDRLEQRVEGARRILETFSGESELPTSVTILDEQLPGAILFERSIYTPDVFFDVPLADAEETADVAVDLPPVAEDPADTVPVDGVSEIRFIRSDVNGDGASDISDVVSSLRYLFGGQILQCLDAADANGDLSVDLADPMFSLGVIFMGWAPPPAPFPDCGPNPAGPSSALGCETYEACSR